MSKLIVFNYLSEKITFTDNGWINATQTAKNFNKDVRGYTRSEQFKSYSEALMEDLNCANSTQLIKTFEGRDGGTFLHPKLAIDFARWISPKFAIWCDKQIAIILNSEGVRNPLKNTIEHAKRYELNKHNIPKGYFCMLKEMITDVILPLEMDGKDLIKSSLPDGSLGIGFCNYLRKLGYDTSNLKTYKHTFKDRITVEAKLYPNALYPLFKEFLDTWINGNGKKYFTERTILLLKK